MPDIENDPEFIEFAERVQRELVPMIKDSAVTISLVPKGPADIKYAVELGLSIMLDKPIIVAVQPGTQIPAKLAKIADEIVELDLSTSRARALSQARVAKAMDRIVKKGGL